MSDSSAAAAPIPPGWYDDGTGSGLKRWWSGVEWTQHVSTPYSMGAAPRPALPADRPVYSVWIWLIVLMPLLSSVAFLFWQPNFDYIGSNMSAPSSISAMYASIFSPAYFAILFLGLIIYGLSALFAWRDAVWLRAQGVERPFSWPWVFLLSSVYVIGRSVIVRRVAKPRGLGPIWVLIAVYVTSLTVSMVWSLLFFAGFMSSFMSNLPAYNGQYS